MVTHPAQWLRFTGLTPEPFATLAQRLTPLWQAAARQRLTRPTRQRAIGAGRRYTLAGIEDTVLPVRVFYRRSLTEELLGWLFGRQRRHVNRRLAKIAPRTPRRSYSGKRTRHPLTTPLTVSRRGRLLHVSEPAPGRVHDDALFKRLHMADRRPPETTTSLARGADGAATDFPTPRFVLPIQRRRNKRGLTRAERRFDDGQASQRSIVEHFIARLKKYPLLAQVSRPRVGQYGQRVRHSAALVNVRTPRLVGA